MNEMMIGKDKTSSPDHNLLVPGLMFDKGVWGTVFVPQKNLVERTDFGTKSSELNFRRKVKKICTE